MSTQSNGSSMEPNAGLPEWAVEMLLRRPPPPDLGLWSPPEDPSKPNLPYVPGFTIQIHRHVAPPSFLDSYSAGKEPRPPLSEEYLKTVTQSKAVVDNPPIETTPSIQPETAQLIVTAILSIGASRGPQVVSCSVTRQTKTEDGLKPVETIHAAAKTFDPLYYNFKRSIGNYPRDCTYEADEDYSVEAAAYQALQEAGETGSSAPEYHGCWTFSLPINIDGNQRTRPIRLILMEQLNGISNTGTQIQNNPDKDVSSSGGGCSICETSTCGFNPNEPLIEVSDTPKVTFSNKPVLNRFISADLLGDGLNRVMKQARVKLPTERPNFTLQPPAASGQKSAHPQQSCNRNVL
ncbi:hypothetical protein Daus18300_013772 [Diaporthe australafricana]|uniref:Uncharacterized protein n=1 Tax=Diaporthe australafricana TaxID=127596 RepID=A0ABR3VXY3_9PEZI